MTAYLDAFNAGDLNAILALFAPDALIYSPTQPQPKKPQEFYPGLLERSKGTRFTLKATFTGDQPHQAAVLFDYHKKLPDGGTKTFDCVDIFSFNNEGKVIEMHIIFDTKQL